LATERFVVERDVIIDTQVPAMETIGHLYKNFPLIGYKDGIKIWRT